MRVPLTKRTALLLVVALLVLINLSIFLTAYPDTFKPESPTLARDFSAYYIGAWRLLHNPTQIYNPEIVQSDYQIQPHPQPFKYVPSFLIMFTPFLSLNYQSALNAFDISQALLILALGFFVYKLIEDKNIFIAVGAAVIVIVDPILMAPSASYNIASFFHQRMFHLNLQTFSPSYLCGYGLANAHILQTVLLVGALYFGYTKKPWLSALFFAFGVFDPREALVALPLLLWYNRDSLWKFVGGAAGFLATTNLPFFLYQGIGWAFLTTETKASIVSQVYLYDWIPVYAIGALTVAELLTFLLNRRRLVSKPNSSILQTD